MAADREIRLAELGYDVVGVDRVRDPSSFGLDHAHLPGDCPVTPLADVAAALAAAGLVPEPRYSAGDGDAFEPDGGHVVTVDRRPG